MQTKKLSKLLKKLGLSEKESQVYLTILELGDATVQDVSKRSGVARTSIYNFLENMKEMGLISDIKKGNKRMLIAEDPEILLDKVKQQVEEIEEAIPDFMSIYNRPENKPQVRLYQGKDGLKQVYEDTLKYSNDLHVFSDFEKILSTMDQNWMWNYADRRKEKNIKAYSIAKKDKTSKTIKQKDEEQLRETKLVSDVKFETEINIYGDKVAMLSFKKPYTGVVIQDKAIAQTLLSVWKMLWKGVK